MESNPEKNKVRKIVVAICGASGSIYGVRLIEELVRNPLETHLIVSDAGKTVLAHEMEYLEEPFVSFLEKRGAVFHPKAALREHHKDNLFAPPASGSFHHDGMVIAPCSMNTLGAVSSGAADDLIRRSADVALKERRPLILVTRETPLNAIHLENMLRLARAGAAILPACPGFYNRPQSVKDLVDSVTARVLDHVGVKHSLVKPWGEKGDSPIHV